MPTPWAELDDLQKREAIARRLGWKPFPNLGDVRVLYMISPDARVGKHPIQVPDWPTNDGLAFEQVWPKITDPQVLPQYMLGINYNGRYCVFWKDYADLVEQVQGETWADAICHALYDLTPEPEGK